MNPTPQTTTTMNLESLRKAVQEFKPNTRREPFNQLKPHHAAIVELRQKKASYASIAEILMQHGVRTSLARVAEYGRIVLEGGKRRKHQKYCLPAPISALAPKPEPASGSNPSEPNPYRSRGPHIANVVLMPPKNSAV